MTAALPPLVQPYDNAMAARFLKGSGLRYLTDQDGDFQVPFSHEDKWGGEVVFWFISAGKMKEIAVIRGHSTRLIPEADWPRLMELCNTWNAEKRWPKAYLLTNLGSNKPGRLVAEQQFDLEKGIHYELYEYFARQSMAVTFQFFEWIHEHGGL